MKSEVKELKTRALSYIDKRRDEIIKLCSKLIQIPSENPPGDVTEIASFIKDYIEEHGVKVDSYETDRGRVNLISEIGEKGPPHLILNGHMDVVPAGNRSRWDFPPYCGEIKGDEILGRGSSDMKGGLAGLISAFIAFPDLEIELPGFLTFTAVPDEETGGQYGARWLVEEKGVIGDACLLGEPTDLTKAWLGEKGVFWIIFEARGKPAHGSVPVLGENAIMKIDEIVSLIRKEFEMKEVRAPSDVADDIRVGKDVLSEMAEKMGYPEKAGEVGRLLDRISVNVGVIKGGTKVNIVPEACIVEIDMRLPFGITPDDVEGRVKQLLVEAGLTDIKYEVPVSSNPNYTPSREMIVKILSDNVKREVGITPRPYFSTAGTDARFFRMRGVPSVHYGMGSLVKAHSYNEAAPIEDLIKETRVYVATIIDFMYT
ncbi:MAG: putative metallohydrolase [Candidatus Bathyarchaeota archaeon BA1]|nr:MAG: putative metallohydrolase [Candidatus Bathyarchaeota archaeon BA1]